MCKIVKTNDSIEMTKLLKKNFFFTAEAHDEASKVIHYDLYEKMELMSKIIFYALPALIVNALMLSLFGLTLINYYIYDLGDESYYSPFPLM